MLAGHRGWMLWVLLPTLLCALTSPPRAQQVEIEWWHAASGALAEQVEELARKFNDSQSKYLLATVNKGNDQQVLKEALEAHRAGGHPQIVQIHDRGFIGALLSNRLVPVHQLLEEQGYTLDWSDMISSVVSPFSYKGRLMAMPLNVSTPVLWYNKQQFARAGVQQPPNSWQQLERQLRTLKTSAGVQCGMSLGDDRVWSWIENYAAINDQPFATLDNGLGGLGTEFVYNTNSIVAQVARMKKWLDDGILQLAGQGSSPRQLFTSGRCAAFISSNSDQNVIAADAKFSWGAAFMPHEENVQPKNSIVGGAGLGVLKGHRREHYEAVAAFLDFLASTPTQVWWHKLTGYLPFTNAAHVRAERERYYLQNPALEIALLQVKREKPTVNSLGLRLGDHLKTTRILQHEIEAVFAGKVPQQAMDDSVKRGNEILREFEQSHANR
jgi:sn-glycerol 3-phosphate transport system substrate-binding protein